MDNRTATAALHLSNLRKDIAFQLKHHNTIPRRANLEPNLLPKLHETIREQLDLPSRKRREIVGLVGENSIQSVSNLEFFKDSAEPVG